MTLTFYDYPGAPSPRRAKIALLEKGLDYEDVVVDLRADEHLSEAFKAINPMCTVPAVKLDSGEVLGDNQGIIAWLDAAYPEPPLLGTTPLERAEIASWTARCEFEGLWAIAEVLRNMAPQMRGRALTGPDNYEQIPELVMRGVTRLQRFWSVLDERLEGRRHLATDSFSWTDITAVAAVDFSKVVKQMPGEQHANIHRWRNKLNERESVRATNVKKG